MVQSAIVKKQIKEGVVEVSLLRQVALLFPAALLFGFLSPGLVWLSFPVAEGLSCLAALFLCRRTARLRLAGL